MKTHIKKIEKEYFEEQLKDNKNFEIRKNDCKYQIGDRIILDEIEFLSHFVANTGKIAPNAEHFSITGRFMIVMITYITDYAQKEGYVVLGTKELCRYVEKE